MDKILIEYLDYVDPAKSSDELEIVQRRGGNFPVKIHRPNLYFIPERAIHNILYRDIFIVGHFTEMIRSLTICCVYQLHRY